MTTHNDNNRIEVSGDWPALTLTLSPEEREQQRSPLEISNRACFADRLTMILPLLGESDGVRAGVPTHFEFRPLEFGFYN
jgi:hypothetical protein